MQRARECPRADDLIDLQLMVPAADRVLVRGSSPPDNNALWEQLSPF